MLLCKYPPNRLSPRTKHVTYVATITLVCKCQTQTVYLLALFYLKCIRENKEWTTTLLNWPENGCYFHSCIYIAT